jgi:glycosyltransferase involved in cell wall biosynthesis
MLLTILIPTYNRVNDLLYNLRLLEPIIIKNNLKYKIAILISDNNSSDSTGQIVSEYLKTSELEIRLFNQTENIGLEKNALFCLAKATSEYIMYLSDDDYVREEYVCTVINTIS